MLPVSPMSQVISARLIRQTRLQHSQCRPNNPSCPAVEEAWAADRAAVWGEAWDAGKAGVEAWDKV